MKEHHLDVRIYEPRNTSKSGFSLVKEMFDDFFNSLGLAKRLFSFIK